MGLDFERADYGVAPSTNLVCTRCGNSITHDYYSISELVVCPLCHGQELMTTGGGVNRFFRALGAGLLVAIAGGAAWWAVAEFFNFRAALLAIAIAYGVARAIAWGTKGRSGRGYQVLAVLLTYAGIAVSYIPDLAREFAQKSAVGLRHVIAACIVSVAAPVVDAANSPIFIVIMLIGLYEAWKLTGRVNTNIQGPFRVTPAASTISAG